MNKEDVQELLEQALLNVQISDPEETEIREALLRAVNDGMRGLANAICPPAAANAESAGLKGGLIMVAASIDKHTAGVSRVAERLAEIGYSLVNLVRVAKNMNKQANPPAKPAAKPSHTKNSRKRKS